MKARYSGKHSKKFWGKVNSLNKRQEELYSLGCCLQNLENFVLKQLDIAVFEDSKNTNDFTITKKAK
jgi:hypothetical protein